MDDERYALHLVPTGVLYPNCVPVIGPGVVVSPQVLIEEMDALEGRGIDTSRLLLSGNAHLIMPYHLELDRLIERRLGKHRLGTTKRGIGPAYADKASRIGLRVQDLLDPKIFSAKLEVALKEKNLMLTRVFGRLPVEQKEVEEEYLTYGRRLAPHIADTSQVLQEALDEGKTVLFEGAQATLLDLDHGTYPYVTSSNPIAGGACAGAGVGPRDITRVIGVSKAYCTRVGSGPFPTELDNELGRQIATRGNEFGSTTGRPRRCGWFDAPALKRSIQINGFSGLGVTKLDVLDGMGTVRLATGYRVNAGASDILPQGAEELEGCEPIYEEMPGWKESTVGLTGYGQLPRAARDYLGRIEEVCGVPIDLISTGAERAQTIVLRHPFEEQ